jgi:D-alanine transaminase
MDGKRLGLGAGGLAVMRGREACPAGRVAYVNGRYCPRPAAQLDIEDRGFQFGDAVYEVVALYRGRFLDEERHLDRLDRSLAALAIPAPMSRAALRHVMRETARRNRVWEGLVYMQVTRGAAPREHALSGPPSRPGLVVTARSQRLRPEALAERAVAAISWPDERWAHCDIKTTNLLPNVLARQAARARGAQEAILIDRAGMVTEGAATTVWIVDASGVLRTRSPGPEILPGCTRAALLAALRARGVACSEGAFSLEALREAREIILTSATSFAKPVLSLDGAPVGDGEIGPTIRTLSTFLLRTLGIEEDTA